MKPDLYNQPVRIDHIRKFVNDVTELAISDHATGHAKRSGSEIVDDLTVACRRGHTRMASSIYNKVRWTLDTKYNG